MKSAAKLLLTLIYLTIIKILLLCLVDIQKSSCEDNANSMGNLRGQKVLKSTFSGFQNFKIQNFGNPPPGYTGYVTNLF